MPLPGGGLQDMQITVEYVVHAIRYMHATSGRKVSGIGRSRGGLLNAWALRFWPDLPGYVDDAISLGPPHRGSQEINVVRRAPRVDRPGPSATAIGFTTDTDELVQPAPVATECPAPPTSRSRASVQGASSGISANSPTLPPSYWSTTL